MRFWNFTAFNANFCGGLNGYSQFIANNIQFSKFVLNRYITPNGTAPTTGTVAPNKGLWFKPDGTIVYYGTGTAIRSWDLTTPWDVATYTNNVITGNLLNTGGVAITNTSGLCFQSDGLAFFVTAGIFIYKYSLGTAWDISSINTTAAQQLDLTPSTYSIPRGIYIDPSDTYISLQFSTPTRAVTYTLATPGDLSTATLTDDVSATAVAVHFIDNGTKAVLWASDVVNDNQNIYTVTNPYRVGGLSSTTLVQSNMVATGANTVGWTPYWRTDGEGYYYSNTSTLTINQFNLTADPAPTYRPDAFCFVKPNVLITSETSPTDLDFKSDGTIVYIIGSTRDRPRQATLSTPWDLSTAGTQTALGGVLIAADGITALASPAGITVTDSGTKMFIVDSITNILYKYTLHTPYDITTAGTTSGNGIADQEVLVDTISAGTVLSTNSVRFNSAGTKCITVNASGAGTGGRRITVWDLSTAWDLSTISENSSSADFTAAGFVGVHWSDDGTKIWALTSSANNDMTYYWTLTTPYDVSGITSGNFIARRDIDNFDSIPTGIYVTSDGSGFYLMGNANDRVYNLTNN